jgi:regulator of replication initiation timing
MKQIYSDHLVAYLFDEIEPKLKASIQKELRTNSKLRKELADLNESLSFIQKVEPMSVSQKTVDTILEQSEPSEFILAD